MRGYKNTLTGFTLLETVIAISIIVMIATIFTSAFSTFVANQELEEAHVVTLGILKDARSRTLSSKSSSNYGVHFEENKIVLFSGTVYVSSTISNEAYVLPRSVKVGLVNLGGASEVVFTRLFGTTTASGTVNLESQRSPSRIKIINVSPSGSVE